MISMTALINVVLWLIVAGVVYWLVTWAIGQIGVPEPFNKVIRVILVIIVFLICLNALFMLFGRPLFAL